MKKTAFSLLLVAGTLCAEIRVKLPGGSTFQPQYRTPVEINGVAGEFTAGTVLGADAIRPTGLKMDTVLSGSRRETTLRFPFGTVFRVDKENKTGLPFWPTEFPAAGNVKPLFTAANESTRALFAVAESEETPEGAFARIDSSLRADGWSAMAAAAGTGLYARGGLLCAVLAQPDRNGRTQISVLQRKGKTE